MIQKKVFVYFFVFPLILLTGFLLLAKGKPLGDFGNYYYGSKIWAEGKDLNHLYNDIHWFNEQIKTHGEKDFFENYRPVPPFSLVLYRPFTFLSSSTAKLLFNIISCIVFCFSLARVARLQKWNYKYVLGIAILILPLYNNLAQGQSYLLITAILFEIYIAYRRDNKWLIAFLIAFIFHLKLFPVFILGYFLFRKEYKIVLFSTLMIVGLTALTILILGTGIVQNYFTEIAPRLMRNEIIDPFYFGHQSINIFLNDLFCYDAISNPDALINNPYLVGVIEGIIVGFIIYFAYSLVSKSNEFVFYALFIFCGVLISRYVTSYFLFLLLPFAISVIDYKRSNVIIIALLISCNIPLSFMEGMPLVLKYFRILLMLAVFVLVFFEFKPKLNYAILLIIGIVFSGFNFFKNRRYENHYYVTENKPGVLYGLRADIGSVVVKRCLGSRDFSDTIKFHVKINSVTPALDIGNKNVIRAYRINDSILVYLSDFQQGIGMYKLRMKIDKR